MEVEDDLSEYAHMWDGSENWRLEQFHNHKADIFVVFAGPSPTVQELVALRRVSEAFREIPVAQLKAELAGKGEVPLGRSTSTFYRLEAREAEERVRKSEPTLQLRVESSSYLSYLPVWQGENGRWTAYLIEDEDVHKRVTAKMVEHGVLVNPYRGHIEVD